MKRRGHIIFDTSAIKLAITTPALQAIILQYGLWAPKRLETEINSPSLVQSAVALIGRDEFEFIKDGLFQNITRFPRSVTKKYESSVIAILTQFGSPIHSGDVEYLSLCIAKKPCIFVTEDSGLLIEKLVAHLEKNYGIEVLDCERFIEQYC